MDKELYYLKLFHTFKLTVSLKKIGKILINLRISNMKYFIYNLNFFCMKMYTKNKINNLFFYFITIILLKTIRICY